MPVEGSTKRIWFWLDMPQEVPAVGDGRSIREAMGHASEEV